MSTSLQSSQRRNTERRSAGVKSGWRRTRGLALALATVVIAPAAGALVAGAVAKARLQATYPPVGHLVDVGGYQMHIACVGAGSPTVVLEAGAGNIGLHWARVQPAVAKQTRVCVYDRAGLGWSEPSPQPRTAAVMAEELATLLIRAQQVLLLCGRLLRQLQALSPQLLAGIGGAGPVLVQLTPEGPQADTLAPDILATLESEPEARTFFESLATFYRNGYVRWIESARRPETRSARIIEMLSLLKAGKKQR